QDNGTNMLKNGSWTHVLGADGMEAVTDYSNANIMYGATQNGGLNRSFDGGQSFSSATNGITENGSWVTPYVIDPENPEILYAGYQRVWKTENRAGSWSPISNSFGINITVLTIAPSDAQTLYAGYTTGLFVTRDGGSNWTSIASGLPLGSAALRYVTVSDVDPEKIWAVFSGFSSGNKVFESTDAGASWTNISGNLPNIPVNCIIHQQSANDALYVGTDNGVFYRRPGTNDWEAYNTSLPNVIVQELEIHYGTLMLRAATYGRGIWESPLAAFGPAISHQPLDDTEDLTGPYNVELIISEGSSPVIADSLFVYYGLNGDLSNRAPLVQVAQGGPYQGEIPGSGAVADVTYYISISDSLEFTAVSPTNAPAEYYSFYTGPDTIPPSISHIPVPEANVLELPLSLSAMAVDNLGIGNVEIDYSVNGGTASTFGLLLNDETWSGNFPFTASDVSIGDMVEYEVVARDVSGNGNETRIGPFSFPIEKIYQLEQEKNQLVLFGTPVSDTISFATSESMNVRDVVVSFQATHTNTGDLKLELRAPSGQSAVIVERPGHPASPLGNQGNNPDILLLDSATESIENITFGQDDDVVGNFQPFPELLSSFSGAALDGEWILTVSDEFSPFSGTFDKWGMKVYISAPTGIGDDGVAIPSTTRLYSNYPNPFNPETTLRYDIGNASKVELVIYNLLGQKVRTLVNTEQAAGSYSIKWDGLNDDQIQLASGVYIYRLKAGDVVQSRKMMLLK
ncbi:MAG: T9SS type A sorting domain-containing protein, partial [Calditrichota bacterium]